MVLGLPGGKFNYEICCLLFRVAYLYDITSHFADSSQIEIHRSATLAAYRHAHLMARGLSPLNPFKLQFTLWHSAFLFESLGRREAALEVAEAALREAGQVQRD